MVVVTTGENGVAVSVCVVVVTVEAQDVTSVVGESPSAMVKEDDTDNEEGGVFGEPKFNVEEGEDKEGGGVFGDPKFKVEEDKNEEGGGGEAGLVAGAPKSEEDEGEDEKEEEIELATLLLLLVLVLVLSGQGPNGECASIDVPCGAITIVMVSEMMVLQGIPGGSTPSWAEEEGGASGDDNDVAADGDDEGVALNESVGELDPTPTDEDDEDVVVGTTIGGPSKSGPAEAKDEGAAGLTVTMLTLKMVVGILSVTVVACRSDAKTGIEGGKRSVEMASALPAVSETQMTSVASKGGGMANVKAEMLATVLCRMSDVDGDDSGELLLLPVVIVGTNETLSELGLATKGLLLLLLAGKTVDQGTQTEPN